MSDEDWERARSDHYRGRRYEQERESENYTLARQQLQNHEDTMSRQRAARGNKTQSQTTASISLSSPVARGIGVAAIIGLGWLYLSQPSPRTEAQRKQAQAHAFKTNMATNLDTLRTYPTYKGFVRRGLDDPQAMLAAEASFIRYLGKPYHNAKAGAGDLETVRSFCGPLCVGKNTEELVGLTSFKIGHAMNRKCDESRDTDYVSDFCAKAPAEMDRFIDEEL